MEDHYVGILSFSLLILALVVSIPEGGEPAISRVVPDVSLSTTDRKITIEGENFSKDSLVYIGDQLLRGVKIASKKLLKASIPKDLDVGTYPVKVLAPGHRDVDAAKLTIVPSETSPVINSISPKCFSNDSPRVITIAGENFRKGARVFLGHHQELKIHERKEKYISAVVIDGTLPGKHDIRVVNSDGEIGCLPKGLTISQPKAL